MPKAELGRSPFRIVNYKVLKPNEEEGREYFTLIVAQQVYDPSDPGHMQEFNIVDGSGHDLNGYNAMNEVLKGAKNYTWLNREGVFKLPHPRDMADDFIRRHARFKDHLLFYEKFGFLNEAGEVDNERIIALINDWLKNGRIPDELESLWVLSVNETINEERAD